MFARMSFCASTVALITGAGSAVAGGYIAPLAETPVLPVVAAPAADTGWAGGYAGVGLGYVFGGDDELGLDVFDENDYYAGDPADARAIGIDNLKLSGAVADVRLGYRWQRDRLVFGPELSIDGGSVDDSWSTEVENPFPLPGEPLVDTATIETSMKYSLNLNFKTGYLVRPDTMVYGSAGVVRGKFDYTLAYNEDSVTEDYSATGYSVGFGVERKITDRLSVFGEYNYRNYGKTDVVFDAGSEGQVVTRGTPEHSIVKLGVNFSF